MTLSLMTERRWNEFFNRLEGPEGCDFKEEPNPDDPAHDPKITWRCKGGMDKTYAKAILEKMRVANAWDVLHHVEMLGGHCDCEILMNAVERVYEDIDRELAVGGVR